ncbi:MAG: insulinase family protein [Clostridia bacterium]|nr:insulinase family protein [Clostridia bacterium]
MFKIKELHGGVRLIYQNMPYAKSVASGIFIKSGSAFESGAFCGISHFIEHMLFKGTKTRSALDIATLSELTGGRLNAYTDRECTCIYTRTLPEDLDISFELMSDMVLNSVFDSDSIQTEKSVVLEEIKMYEDNPEELVHDILAEITYPSHPIGQPIVGTAQSVEAFTPELINEYMKSRYIGNNIVISVFGKFNEQALIEKAEKLFENVRPGIKELPLSPAEFVSASEIRQKSVEQSHIALAFPGYPSSSDNKYSLNLISNIFGGSSNSRLFQKIREELGLAYSVYSCPSIFTTAGYTALYAACATENLELVKNLLLEEAHLLSSKGISEEELEFSKKQFACSFVLSSENCSSLMSSAGRQLLLLDRVKTDEEILTNIKSVDISSANNAAKLFNPEYASTAIITP